MFTSIKIQTAQACNRRCGFCPKSVMDANDQRMDDSLFELVLQQLRAMDYSGRVTPFLQNEPLLDQRMPGFIRHIKQLLPKAYISLSTNGDRLVDVTLRKALAGCGLDSLLINCYGSHQLYEQRRELADEWARECRQVAVHTSGDACRHPGLPGTLRVRVRWVPAAQPDFWNFAGAVPAVAPADEQRMRHRCNAIFEQLCVNCGGDAVLCCADWRNDIVLGNVAERSLGQLWESERLREYRACHDRHETAHLPLCQACNRIAHRTPDTDAVQREAR